VRLLIGGLRAVRVFLRFELGLVFALLDAAESLQAATLAGFGVFAGIDFGATGEEVAGQLLDVGSPVDEQLG
jgi:hypothetical protein